MNWWTIMTSRSLAQAAEAAGRAQRAARFREHRRRLRESKQAKETGRDDTQDARLAALERELEQTQVALGALAQLLLAHAVVPRDELAALLDDAEGEDGASGASREG